MAAVENTGHWPLSGLHSCSVHIEDWFLLPRTEKRGPGRPPEIFAGGLPLMSVAEMELLQENDLGSFLDTHGDEIFTYLCVLCKDEDRASESLQNAYLKFLEQIRRGRVRRDSAPQYLQTIAKNDYFSQLRREKREVPLHDDPVDTASRDQSRHEEIAREMRLVLMETIADSKLPEDLRAVIRLRFLENADVEAICRHTSRSQATVYRMMEKALPVLADACRKAGLHPEDLGL